MDKLLHFGVNFIVVITASIFGCTGIGISLAIGLSIGKEYGDYHNVASTGYALDLLADAIGIIVAIGISAIV
jgi:hypothetical protein